MMRSVPHDGRGQEAPATPSEGAGCKRAESFAWFWSLHHAHPASVPHWRISANPDASTTAMTARCGQADRRTA